MGVDEKQGIDTPGHVAVDVGDSTSIQMTPDASMGRLHRRLNNRRIQLIATGGAIGTALFVSIGGALAKGGPASLFVAWTLYSGILALVNNSLAEMNTYMPIAGGHIRLAGYWVDDALGFLAGWNFFLYQALSVPFEIAALTSVVSYWNANVLTSGGIAGVCAATIACYAVLNTLHVKFYGESEFWLSGGKLILVFIFMFYRLVTMCGGNPKHDAYGFRYFSDGFVTYLSEGSKGRFEGFLAALWTGSLTIVGPEYIAMVSAEAQRPSYFLKAAYKTVYWRFCAFFVLGSFCVGIVCKYNDPTLYQAYMVTGSTGNAASSPYVIAMTNLGISGLPHLCNALILTSIFSAGNTYIYASSRTLYSLAVGHRAPHFLRYCTKAGVPIYCVFVSLAVSFLSFLQVKAGSAVALGWFTTIITGGGLINYITINVTFINYWRACKAQGFDRKSLPYYGRFQPYGAILALSVQIVIVLTYGYYAFRPKWDYQVFFQNYSMQIMAVLLFCGWKVGKRTRYIRPSEVDLVWERPSIDAYEASFDEPPMGFWREMWIIVTFRAKKDTHVED